ncbi:hypothetical protein [Streptomyces purpureus]|uniref:Integral membrane protein n=1 Tax=Streptomyces purpureus TaxID=1951 RepID=A0A918GXU9_9ACTN|nr:hypothetical protein [Streptomyces purpureus]GGT13277.1 hypothetical protein GCM10014713_02240 [Streptomyces purpureus]
MRAARALAVAATAIAALGLMAPAATATSGGPITGGGDNRGPFTGGGDGRQNAGGGDGRGHNVGGGDGRGPNAGGNGDNRGPTDVTVNPFSVHQGATLTITVRGCDRGGTVSSNAFPTINLSQQRSGVSTAVARIHDHATPGDYNLAVRCNDGNRVATAQFRVLSGRGAQGGLGGSLGPSSTEMAVGGGLFAAAALGGGIFVLRRRRMHDSKA